MGKEKEQTILHGRFKVSGNFPHQSAELARFNHTQEYSHGIVKVNHTSTAQINSLNYMFIVDQTELHWDMSAYGMELVMVQKHFTCLITVFK